MFHLEMAQCDIIMSVSLLLLFFSDGDVVSCWATSWGLGSIAFFSFSLTQATHRCTHTPGTDLL